MDNIKEFFKTIVSQSKKDQVKVELLLNAKEQLSISFQNKKLKKYDFSKTQVAGLRVIKNGAQGFSYTEKLEASALLNAYTEALKNATDLVPTNDLSLRQEIPMLTNSEANKTPPNEMAATREIEKLGEEGSCSQEADSLVSKKNNSIEEKLNFALALEESCLNFDSKIEAVPYSALNEVLNFTRILNSEGVDKNFRQKYYSGYVYPLAKTENSSKVSGVSFFSRNFAELDPKKVAEKASSASLERLDAKKLKTGFYHCVISNEEFTNMLTMIARYFSAKRVFEGKSLFKDKLNTKVANNNVTIIDDPFYSKSPEVRNFDSEGVPSQKTTLIEQGTLKNYLTNLEYAQKLNLPNTASADRTATTGLNISVSNLIFQPGIKSLSDLLSKNEQTLYITEFTAGLHAGFKEATGEFSLPAEGFLYQKGQKQYAVEQFIVSGNILDLLFSIDEIGNDLNEQGSNKICPSVLISRLSVAGE